MTHRIEAPHPTDADAVGRMGAWLQTYPNDAAGIDETWIREQRRSAVTTQGTTRRLEFIAQTGRRPNLLFCRVVLAEAEIVGLLCARREETVTLGPMYLLNETQSQGIGHGLMGEYLPWAEDAPIHLWVTDYTKRAIRFYEHHGFKLTGERELWRGRLPNVRMVCDSMPNHELFSEQMAFPQPIEAAA
ncbi:GNAT family N-acetyltransferase (plasmid) [Embleya sp. NBC_00888]|uniref:GNAT family N-acetyltransferase n=1 Tax=Embleya sp. NBC_00888 TaxID=2975960 RepID=UPI002F917435|nr:GNAT family N-acetyltransferase [Embleya sp. NBC_00888]